MTQYSRISAIWPSSRWLVLAQALTAWQAFLPSRRSCERRTGRRPDVDLAAGIIQVTQAAGTVHKPGIVISEPTTDQSRRSLGMPPMLIAALREHQTNHYAELVFSTRNGTSYGSRNVLSYFHRALNKAGSPNVSLHSLRHLHATVLLQ